MKVEVRRIHFLLFAVWVIGIWLTGCVAFEPAEQSRLERLNDRPFVAILPYGSDLEIATLSTVQTVERSLPPEDEARQLRDALNEIEQETRRDKKEAQLTLNLAEVMESLGDELTKQGFRSSQLRQRTEFAPP